VLPNWLAPPPRWLTDAHWPADLGPLSEPSDLVTLFGAPAFVYAELFRTVYLWAQAVGRRGDSLFHAHQFRHLCRYLRTNARKNARASAIVPRRRSAENIA